MLAQSYNYDLVVASVLIATVGAYVAIEIAQRVRAAVRRRRLFWVYGGALAMGLGIWSMHFVGMLALRLPAHGCLLPASRVLGLATIYRQI